MYLGIDLGTSEVQLPLRAELASDDSAVNAPIFLPYLAGERTPHNAPFAPGALS